MIYRVIGADNGIEFLIQFEFGHILAREFYPGEFLSGIFEHRGRDIEAGYIIMLGKWQEICTSATGKF
jgi:hypothetical protein